MFRKESFCGPNSFSQMKMTFKSFVICFNCRTVFSFALFHFRKHIKKLLRNFEYLKSQKAKKLSFKARPKFLIKVCILRANKLLKIFDNMFVCEGKIHKVIK